MNDDDSGQTNDWKRAFERRSAADFADALAEDVVLEATIMYKPVVERENVKLVMEAASKFYENLIFTDQAVDGVARLVSSLVARSRPSWASTIERRIARLIPMPCEQSMLDSNVSIPIQIGLTRTGCIYARSARIPLSTEAN
jgi:hypothetical protein